MLKVTTVIPLAISIAVTLLATPKWIKIAERCRLLGLDMNKISRPEIAEIGGVPTLMGFLAGVFTYLLFNSILNRNSSVEHIMALLLTVSLAGAIGLVDDMIGWKVGLRQVWKIWLGLFASLPLVVVSMGRSTMTVPFLGSVKLGLFYPLILIPLGITGAANGFNMLAGYNGLEAKMGTVILTVLGIVCWRNEDIPVAVVSLSMAFALSGFLLYNRYPARVFPGNTLTYSVGASIGSVAILAKAEATALILFLPYFVQLCVKARSGFRIESFAQPKEDGTLEVPYQRYYALEHVAIGLMKKFKGDVREPNVSTFFMAVECLLGAFVLLV
ncbi:MAG: glycosyl transferase family 4 [Chloroflexi bacterium]|nr:MAG: glycosyl transferase family 4 [Chloroflexota bacterium]